MMKHVDRHVIITKGRGITFAAASSPKRSNQTSVNNDVIIDVNITVSIANVSVS